MKLIDMYTHTYLFPQNLKYSFSQKFGRIQGNVIKFNEVFTKTPKITYKFNYLF